MDVVITEITIDELYDEMINDIVRQAKHNSKKEIRQITVNRLSREEFDEEVERVKRLSSEYKKAHRKR